MKFTPHVTRDDLNVLRLKNREILNFSVWQRRVKGRQTSNFQIFSFEFSVFSGKEWSRRQTNTARPPTTAGRFAGRPPKPFVRPTDTFTPAAVRCASRTAGEPTCSPSFNFSNFYIIQLNGRRHVFEIPITNCIPQERATSKCPSDCKDVQSDPVCGSDGNIYHSLCELQLFNCG